MRNLTLLWSGRKRKIFLLILLSIILVPTTCLAFNICIIPRDYAVLIARSYVTSSRNYRENGGFDLKFWGTGQVNTPWGPIWRTIWSYSTSHVGVLGVIGRFAVTVDVHGVTGIVVSNKLDGTGVLGVFISDRDAIFHAKQYMVHLYEIPFPEIDFINVTSIKEIPGLTPGWLMNLTFHDLDLGTIFVDVREGLTIIREGIPSHEMPNNTVSILGAIQISWGYVSKIGHHYFFERAWLRRNNSAYIWHVQWNYCVGRVPSMGMDTNFTFTRSVISVDGRHGSISSEEILETSTITRSEADQRIMKKHDYGDCTPYDAVRESAKTDTASQYIRLENVSVTVQPKVYDDKKCWAVIYTLLPTAKVLLQVYVDAWTWKVIAIIP